MSGIADFIMGRPCVDCRHRTHSKFNGKPMCSSCQLDRKIKAENIVNCPKCSKPMRKDVIEEEIIVDRCGCGVWLDKEELKAITESAESSGHSRGLLLGIAIG